MPPAFSERGKRTQEVVTLVTIFMTGGRRKLTSSSFTEMEDGAQLNYTHDVVRA